MKTYSTGFVNEMVTFVDLTPQLGAFTPCLFVYFRDLMEIDISGCKSIDPCLFVDCIAACQNLRKIEMISCTQFNQYHIVNMLQDKPKLKYFESSKGSNINFTNAYRMLSSLPSLEFLNFDPQEIFEQIDDWSNLFRIFRNVHFGINIMRFFPFYGKYVRNPALDSEM